jgi:4-aminobutyrate aminotransferase-like enzyme
MRKRSPRTAELLESLGTYESRNVTQLTDASPIVWETASGAEVTDVDGNQYIDLTSAFGVANLGHSNPRVVAAIADQAARLTHGMGDVYPNVVKVRLLERLPSVVPPGLSKAFLATTGSEAVEAALKTAILCTGKSRFAAFAGAYHGLTLGALPLCGIETFSQPFAGAVGESAIRLEYPTDGTDLDAAIAVTRSLLSARSDLAALIVEPIQGRAGCVVPPHGYLKALRTMCSELHIVMIADEIYTGFGRTGSWFAVDEEKVVPDVMCIGKAMGSGFPISAAIGRPEIMDAWPRSTGEALHTSTYLGNPVGCAAALVTIDEMQRLQLPQRARELGVALGGRLHALRAPALRSVRGRGLFWGLQLRDASTAASVVERALHGGVIVLQAGIGASTITIAPPLIIAQSQLDRAIDVVEAALADVA